MNLFYITFQEIPKFIILNLVSDKIESKGIGIYFKIFCEELKVELGRITLEIIGEFLETAIIFFKIIKI